MNGPDGTEQREAEREEAYERDLDDALVDEQLADDSHAPIDIPAQIAHFAQTAFAIKRERDELAATLRDIIFGCDAMLEPALQLTGAFRAYVLEVKRVAEAVLE